MPYLKKQNGKTVLMVQDKPFIMLCGELNNSTSSTAVAVDDYLQKAVALGMNSVIASLSWELVEPEEGKFDFSTIDMLMEKARAYDLKLVLIWFASWKNAQCFYAPQWVKKDLQRFPRAEVVKGQKQYHLDMYGGIRMTTLSYLSQETCQADAKAFYAVMDYIRRIDSEENTVIMMQVENEAGVLGAAREHSDLADALFAGAAPTDLVAYMKAHTQNMAPDVKAAVEAGAWEGSWEECFGSVAEEAFSAYYVATYINQITAAGKRAYNIPMYVNCWLDKKKAPGTYPTGAPVARMMELWQYCAPDVDFFAPDIYVPNFCEVCQEYVKNENPLFIPESPTHSYAGVRQMYAIGKHHALGYAPFGFSTMGQPFAMANGAAFGIDVTDPALNIPQDPQDYRDITRHLDSLQALLCSKYGTDELQAFSSEEGASGTIVMDNLKLHINASNYLTGTPGGVLCVKAEEDTFYLLCTHCTLNPRSADPDNPNLDYLYIEEGYFEDGNWIVTLRRNGDEAVNLILDRPVLLKMKIFTYR